MKIRRWTDLFSRITLLAGSLFAPQAALAQVILPTAPAVAPNIPPYRVGLPPTPYGCMAVRWVGELRTTVPPTCGTPITGVKGFWIERPLFGPGLPGPLARFCTLEWRPYAATPSAAPERPILATRYEDPSPDCAVVNSLAPSTRGLGRELSTAFAHQTHALQGVVVSPNPPPPRALPNGIMAVSTMPISNKVSVAVVDSAVSSHNVFRGRSKHGRTMHLMMETLACVGRFCPYQPFAELALPLYRTSTGLVRDTHLGGEIGGRADLAEAIVRAVRSFLNTGIPRRIMNLSVGWAPEWSNLAHPGAPERAVLTALEYASCHDVLVFAAAGNDSGGPSSLPGFYLPAGYEVRGAPSFVRCLDFEAGRNLSGAYTPLVFAVGGVDPEDRPLANANPGSLARIVAPGLQVTVADPVAGAPGYTPIYSGSSVGTSVASAVATMVWALQPHASPFEVAAEMFGGGWRLALTSNLPTPTGLPVAPSRLTLCHALESICGRSPDCSLRCRSPATAGPSPITMSTTPAWQSFTFTTATPKYDVPAPCFGSVQSAPTIAGVWRPCPSSQFFTTSLAPTVVPQPGKPICRTCLVDGTANHAHFDLDVPPTLVGDVVLTVKLPHGDERYVLPSDVQSAPFEILGLAGPIQDAVLEFTVDDGSGPASQKEVVMVVGP